MLVTQMLDHLCHWTLDCIISIFEWYPICISMISRFSLHLLPVMLPKTFRELLEMRTSAKCNKNEVPVITLETFRFPNKDSTFKPFSICSVARSSKENKGVPANFIPEKQHQVGDDNPSDKYLWILRKKTFGKYLFSRKDNDCLVKSRCHTFFIKL